MSSLGPMLDLHQYLMSSLGPMLDLHPTHSTYNFIASQHTMSSSIHRASPGDKRVRRFRQEDYQEGPDDEEDEEERRRRGTYNGNSTQQQ